MIKKKLDITLNASDTNTPLQRQTAPPHPCLSPPDPLSSCCFIHFLPQIPQRNGRLVEEGPRDWRQTREGGSGSRSLCSGKGKGDLLHGQP